jgi:glycosyltransferase involved in cell wall biosynthesis
MDQLMPTISVVIPTHNRIEILKQTLCHLSEGSVLPDEVIIVDDGSDIHVETIIKENNYNFPVRVIRHKKCMKRAAACNTGIMAAKKEILLLMDDDIFADHDMIKYHKLLHQEHPDIGYAAMGRVVLDPLLVRTPVLHYLEEYGFYRWLARLSEGEIYTAGSVSTNLSVKLNFVKKNGLFDVDFPRYGNEDTEFSLRLMEHGLRVHFHHAPSGRHHRKNMGVEDLFDAIKNGGYSKAYWVSKKPDDTDYCNQIEAYIKKYIWKDIFEKICIELIDSMGDNFFDAPVSQISEAQFSEFRKFIDISESWNVAIGIIDGWSEMVPGFREMIKDIRDGLYCKDKKKTLNYLKKGVKKNPEFFPTALLLAKKLQEANQLIEACQVLSPFSNNIWAKLRMGELYYLLGKYDESLSLLIDVYDRTGHGRAIERKQRDIAFRWFLKILPKSDDNDDWVCRLWDDVTEDDMIWNPDWIKGLESAISGNMEMHQSFEKRFPMLSNLRKIRKREETLNQIYNDNYPCNDAKIDSLLQYGKPKKHSIVKRGYTIIKKNLGYTFIKKKT